MASAEHFAHHLRPIYDALEPEERAGFHTEPLGHGHAIVVASIADYNRARRASGRLVLFEHGAGFSFHGELSRRSGSYAGDAGRAQAMLLPATNRWVQEANARAYPSTPGPIVGCPKMDSLVTLPRPSDGVVAVSFHWNCTVAYETRWALPEYRPALDALARRFKGRIIGHGHPKHWRVIAQTFRRAGIPTVSSFEEVCRRASVYVNDASSTLYEFAALGRPVVVMNARWYRRDVHHGLRFWDHADVGVQVERHADLLAGIEEALEDAPARQEARRAAVEAVYPYLGRSVPRTVEVLREWARMQEGALVG